MKFTIQPPNLVLFSDNLPGSYVTMFGPNGPLPFRDDACSFDIATPAFTWGFQWDQPLKKGTLFVFATTDREVVGEVDATGVIQVSDRKVKVTRDTEGLPIKCTKRIFR